MALLVLPLYALGQTAPLPPAFVEMLSRARVELQAAVSALTQSTVGWTPVSVQPERTFDFAMRLAAYAGVFWIARGLCVRLGRYAFAVAAPVVLIAAAEAAIALHQNSAAGASASYVNRNHLAGLLEMALPFAVAAAAVLARRAARERCDWRAAAGSLPAGVLLAGACALLAAACALLIGAGILATRSRAGLLAALASLLVMGLIAVTRARGAKGRRLTGALLVPVLLGAALVYLPSDGLVRRYGALIGGGGVVREGRTALWRETLDLVAAYPLAGCGFGAYEPAFLRYKRSAPMVNDTHAHNDYLELLAEAGLIGFAICIVLAAWPIAAAVRANFASGSFVACGLALGCAGSLTAILAHSFVDFSLRMPANGMVFFWLLGMCAACGDLAARRASGRTRIVS
jgi:O-antigen ligase